jgi:site-specific recombinase XerC
MEGRGRHRRLSPFVQPRSLPCAPWSVNVITPIAKVQEWLRHANIATTRIYDHRRTRPEDSPTFKIAY